MKKKTALSLTLAILLAAAGSQATSLLKLRSTDGSFIKVSGTSTIHDWHAEAKQIGGAIETAPTAASDPMLGAADWTKGAIPLVEVTVPAKKLSSGNGKMDKIMSGALKADKHPEIRYQMTSASPKGKSDKGVIVATKGKLTVAGVTRDVDMDVAVQRVNGSRFVLRGEAPLKMSSFGITPPTALMGTVKSGDAVTVAFQWVVENVQ